MITRAISLVFLGILLGLTLSSFHLSSETESINSSPLLVEIPKDSTGLDMSYCQVENTAFQIGEELTYKLYYRLKFIWLPAAEVVFIVEETPDGQLHLSATGHTYKTYNMFIKVRDRFESYVDNIGTAHLQVSFVADLDWRTSTRLCCPRARALFLRNQKSLGIDRARHS